MPRVNMTDRFVDGVKPDGARTDYFDTVTKGLTLRVGDSGHKAWSYHFTNPSDGKRARVLIGTYPAKSLASARAKAIEAKGLVDDGKDPRVIFAAEAGGGLTVALLIDSYLTKYVKPNLRTADKVEQRLKKNVIPVIGNVAAADLHRRDINRVLDPIVARKKPVMAARVFEDLRAAFRWAVQRGDLDHSPMEGRRKPATGKPRERVLSDEEIHTLWNGLPKSIARSKSCQRIVKLCLVTAQRVGEVSGMRVDELDLDGKTWSLPGARTKNGCSHLVPLSALAVDIIREALADAGDDPIFVFPEGDAPVRPHAVALTLNRAHKATPQHPAGRFGVAQFTAHDLRRTALTNFAKLGIAPVVAGAVANHLSVTKASITLSVYTQYTYDREKREALDLWAERLGAIVAGKGAKILPLRSQTA